MKKQEIVHTALENLDPDLVEGIWYQNDKQNKGPDGELELLYEGQKVRFDTIIKKEPRTYQVDQIIHQAGKYKNPMLIAYTLFPALKGKLKEHRIHYLEANGNLFVHAKKMLLFLDTDKKLKSRNKTGNRAFT